MTITENNSCFISSFFYPSGFRMVITMFICVEGVNIDKPCLHNDKISNSCSKKTYNFPF